MQVKASIAAATSSGLRRGGPRVVVIAFGLVALAESSELPKAEGAFKARG